MQLTIRAEGAEAGVVSHLLAKNPNNIYDRNEKGARVRMVYTACTDEEVEVVLYAAPDPVELVKGSPDSYDITQYINDREFVVSSLFCTYIRGALGTALNGKPKEAYVPWVNHPFRLTLSFGPVASNLPDRIVEELFQTLGYEVELTRGEADYRFDLKGRSSVRYITLRGEQTLQTALRQLLILIPVLDDYKHHFIGEDEIDKLARYGEGWLDTHPMRELIVRRTLRFSNVIEQFEGRQRRTAGRIEAAPREAGTMAAVGKPDDESAPQTAHEAAAEKDEKTVGSEAESAAVESIGETQPKVRLNELRYQAITDVVSGLAARQTIVDFGSGEGKLSARLCELQGVSEVLAVEPSGMAQLRAIDRFAKLADRGQRLVPTPVTGSLFYYDESMRGKDVIILCEVIEHIDEHRLNRVMSTIIGEYGPKTLIVTTPNQEYNAVYDMDASVMRHNDHRFEWTREQFAKACERWQTAAYSVTFQSIGEEADGCGQPTQMAIFTRREEEPS